MAASTSLLLASEALVILFLLSRALYNIYLHPLRRYPGPWFLASSDIPRLLMVLFGKYVHYNHKLHLQYGDVVRVGPNEISYTNPQAWRDIYNHGKERLIKDPHFMGEMPNGTPHIGTADRPTHARMRKAFSHAFSDRALRKQEALIQSYTDQMVSAIKDIIIIIEKSGGGPGATVDIVDIYNFTAFDMMAELTFGESLRLLENKTYIAWVTALFQGLKFMTLRGVLKQIPIVGLVSEYLISTTLRREFHAHFRFSSDLVDRRLARGDDCKPDIWHFVLDQKTDARLSVDEMHSNAAGLMVGGGETVATALSGLTYFLLENPAVLKKVTEEVRSAFARESEISLLEVARLKYLEACISESLRMYPPAAVGLPRIIPPEGTEVCNERIPGGTTVYVSNYAAYHSPNNFDRAEEFIPERWLDNDLQFTYLHQADVFQPFSVGPRNCIGKSLAWHQMRIIMTKLLWHFDLHPQKKENHGWADQKVYITWEKRPLRVHIVPARL